MLAIFPSSVASPPQELLSPSTAAATVTTTAARHDSSLHPPPPPLPPPSSSSSTTHGDMASALLLSSLSQDFPDALHFSFRDLGAAMAYSPGSPAAPPTRQIRSFASTDGIFCLLEGRIENVASLRQDYGLGKTSSEASLLIHAYTALRDRGPIPPHQVIAGLEGQFAFVLFDSSNRSVLVARDSEGVTVPWFWGTASDGFLVFSDSANLLERSCGKSFAPFPPGCYFTSKMGLQSFVQPSRKLKPVPRVDSKGNALGSLFKVDSNHKGFVPTTMSRVGSEANWSQTI